MDAEVGHRRGPNPARASREDGRPAIVGGPAFREQGNGRAKRGAPARCAAHPVHERHRESDPGEGLMVDAMNERSPDPVAVADGLYAVGFGMIDAERWSDAADVFRAMMLACPDDERAW